MFSFAYRSLWALWSSILQVFFTSQYALRAGIPTQTIEILPRTYKEDFRSSTSEAKERGISIVVYHFDLRWHIRITFLGRLSPTTFFPESPKRREDLENLCRCIDFHSINILDDTVTELVITHVQSPSQGFRLKAKPDQDSQYASIASELHYHTREYAKRVQFPSYTGDGILLAKGLSQIKVIDELALSTHTVHFCDDPHHYVYKALDRLLYIPQDSKTIEQELRNLERLRGTIGIVQLIAPVVSRNPYRTKVDNAAVVLQGFLVEHHPNGKLDDALKANTREFPWD